MSEDKNDATQLSADERLCRQLAEEGFCEKPLTVRLEDMIAGLFTMRLPDGGQIEINQYEVECILDGKGSLGNAIDASIKEWYPKSFYKKARALLDIENEWVRETNPKRKIQLGRQRDSLLNDVFSAETFKDDLSYRWGETGERLERLYRLVRGDVAVEKIQIGSMTMEVPLNQYTPDMKLHAYEQSSGIFNDFLNAYNAIAKMETPADGAPIRAQAFARDYLCMGEHFIEIQALVSRGPNSFITNTRVSPIGLTDEIFMLAVNIEYPEFTPVQNNEYMRYSEKDEIGFHYVAGEQPQLVLFGNPSKLAKLTLPFVQAMLRYKNERP